jgi:hypothetical protein
MSTQHTPGPWKIVSGNANGKFLAASIRPVISPFKGWVLPIASVRNVDESFGQANARLIAAAPDLLEALIALHTQTNSTELAKAHDKARAAIAKANGGSMSTQQPEALRLAETLDVDATNGDMGRKPDQKCHKRQAAAELRRLHSVNAELLEFAKEWLDRQGTDENYMVMKARAAIAKATGEQA